MKKGLGRGNPRLQHNIVDLFAGIPTIQTDQAFKVDGRTHTHTQAPEIISLRTVIFITTKLGEMAVISDQYEYFLILIF